MQNNVNNIYLSKSRYCECVQCMKKLWLKKYKPEVEVPSEKDAVFENGNKVGELAKGLFGKFENVDFDENLSNMIDKINELLKNKPNIITSDIENAIKLIPCNEKEKRKIGF